MLCLTSQFNAALKAFQDKHGPLTLESVGNFDEFFVDLNEFASKKAIFVNDTCSCSTRLRRT